MQQSQGRRGGWGRAAVVGLLVIGVWVYAVTLYYPALRSQDTGTGIYRSDLYESWYGAHELLWRGRDPYSPDITAEIQQGVFGRVLTPGDPITDQMRFVYPLHQVILFAPLTLVPFDILMPLFSVAMFGLVGLMIVCWARALGWPQDRPTLALLIALGLSTMGMVWIGYMQQPALIVLALLAGALAGGRTVLAGVLLALSTVKPQLSGLFVLWLLVWACGDWPRRRGLVRGFAGTGVVLGIATFLLLPDWPLRWWTALQAYQQYALNEAAVGMGQGEAAVGLTLVIIGGGLALAALVWRTRRAPAGSPPFGLMVALLGLYTMILFPGWALNHQFLLYPAVGVLLQQRPILLADGGVGRGLIRVVLGVLLAPWVVATVLAAAWLAAAVAGPAVQAAVARWWPWPWMLGFLAPLILIVPLGLLALRMGRAPQLSSPPAGALGVTQPPPSG